MIKRFDRIEGRYIEKIYGQERLAFAHSDNTDFYDQTLWAERGGHPGDILTFYDFTNGKVYQPFEKQRDVIYSEPTYAAGFYYFLQGNYSGNKITLYRYLPEEVLEAVTSFKYDEVELYNLRAAGNPIHVFSQNNAVFECYYPERISFPLASHQTVTFIEDGKVYLEEWVEEGWDDEHECETEDYKFYNKVIVKDFAGNTLSEEVGFLFPAPDGTYWMA